ncbi:MAG: DNA-directed RNA polymerase subunit P [archaeon]
MYKCMKCGKEVALDSNEKRIRCPYCGYKILVKQRSGAVKTVKSR